MVSIMSKAVKFIGIENRMVAGACQRLQEGGNGGVFVQWVQNFILGKV